MSAQDQPEPAPEAPDPGERASLAMLRAMSHPLRLRIIERIGRRGTARAADLAQDLDLPANSVSYHLRNLARGGVIVEAPEAARDRRDRVWRLSQQNYRAQGTDGSPDGSPSSTGEYRQATLATNLAAIEEIRSAWIAESDGSEAADRDEETAAHLLLTTLRISQEQARELNALVRSAIQRFDGLNRDLDGADVPGDLDSAGGAEDFSVLFTLVRDGHGPDRPATSLGRDTGPSPRT